MHNIEYQGRHLCKHQPLPLRIKFTEAKQFGLPNVEYKKTLSKCVIIKKIINKKSNNLDEIRQINTREREKKVLIIDIIMFILLNKLLTYKMASK